LLINKTKTAEYTGEYHYDNIHQDTTGSIPLTFTVQNIFGSMYIISDIYIPSNCDWVTLEAYVNGVKVTENRIEPRYRDTNEYWFNGYGLYFSVKPNDTVQIRRLAEYNPDNSVRVTMNAGFYGKMKWGQL